MPATGYSATPQATKLGLKSGHRLSLVGAPAGWALQDPPSHVIVDEPQPADVIIAFFSEASALPARLPQLAARIFPGGAIWIAWPRRAGGHTSDITDNVVREHVLPLGLVDVKIAALDEDWSAQRVVWRKERRCAQAPDPA